MNSHHVGSILLAKRLVLNEYLLVDFHSDWRTMTQILWSSSSLPLPKLGKLGTPCASPAKFTGHWKKKTFVSGCNHLFIAFQAEAASVTASRAYLPWWIANSCQLLDERAPHISWHPPYETKLGTKELGPLKRHKQAWICSHGASNKQWHCYRRNGKELKLAHSVVYIFPKRVEPLLFRQLDCATVPLALQKTSLQMIL